MKVWITKYALTKGIFTLDGAELIKDSTINGINVEWNGYSQCFFHNDWHDSFAKAQIDANKRVSKKIDSINKQLRKFSNLRF